MTEEQILSVLSSAEPSTFKDFCRALGDNCPQERPEWAELFQTIRVLEHSGDLLVDRFRTRVDALQLTEQGANRIREYNDRSRPLLQLLEPEKETLTK